jgi:hypothetical protein
MYDFHLFKKIVLEKYEEINVKIMYNLTTLWQILTYICKNILEFKPFRFKI